VVDKIYAISLSVIFNGNRWLGGGVGEKDECLIHRVG